jgi:hypothetical protein
MYYSFPNILNAVKKNISFFYGGTLKLQITLFHTRSWVEPPPRFIHRGGPPPTPSLPPVISFSVRISPECKTLSIDPYQQFYRMKPSPSA